MQVICSPNIVVNDEISLSSFQPAFPTAIDAKEEPGAKCLAEVLQEKSCLNSTINQNQNLYTISVSINSHSQTAPLLVQIAMSVIWFGKFWHFQFRF